MSGAPHAILMGDPRHFSIRGGANPHTRDRWGRRKRVDRALAQAQWRAMADRLTDLGLDVYVVPPHAEHPGLVYPANAGVAFHGSGGAVESFVLANLLPTRAGEQPIYAAFLAGLGVATKTIARRFEGEADFFPVGDRYVFTYGGLERQRFVARFGVPPWRRVYGFRSDREAAEELRPFAGGREIVALELRDEAHYHGDTVLCSFGPGRRHLLAWREGLAPASRARLDATFGDAVIPLSEPDARRYAANSFGLRSGDEHIVVMPAGVSERLLGAVRERGARPLPVDVSEFLAKGGGSVKCMIGDLGPLPPAEPGSAVAAFRAAHLHRPAAAR